VSAAQQPQVHGAKGREGPNGTRINRRERLGALLGGSVIADAPMLAQAETFATRQAAPEQQALSCEASRLACQRNVEQAT